MLKSSHSLWSLVAWVVVVAAAQAWWSRHQQQSLGQQVAQAAAPGDIRMLSSDTCAVCVVARRWMTEHRVPFTECSIERDAGCLQAFEVTHSPGTPVLLVRGQAQVGFAPQRVLAALKPSA